MNKIGKLTPEQERQLEEFKEECFKIGYCIDRIDHFLNQERVNHIYSKYLGINKAPYIWYLESPLQFDFILNIITSVKDFNSDFKKNLHKFLDDMKFENIDDIDIFVDKIEQNYNANIGNINRDEKTSNNFKTFLKNFKIENIYWSNTDIYWISFYFFPHLFLGVDYGKENNEELLFWYTFVKNTGYVWYYEDICFISERPTEINFNREKQVHGDGKHSICFSDGYGLWNLNGVTVPKYIAVTPANDLKAEVILKERNAEVRQEIVRKIGWKRITEELDCKLIEKINGVTLYENFPIAAYTQQGDVLLIPEEVKLIFFKELRKEFVERLKQITYELVTLDIGEERIRPFLKMTNASLPKESHIEGVSPNCKTVFEAICFRNQRKELPYELS